jgi:thioredoxin-dependent peroxiredoxin
MALLKAIEYEMLCIEDKLHHLGACQDETENKIREVQAQKRVYLQFRQQLGQLWCKQDPSHDFKCPLLSKLIAPPCVRSIKKMPITENATVPAVTFKARVRDLSVGGENPYVWKDVTTEHLFKDKRCVLFGIPGAFTPTCSSTHLPGYQRLYEKITACGIDEIYCLSVNDAFVMRHWGLKLGLVEEAVDASNPLNPGNFSRVKLIPDGACLFTRGMGMSCTWASERGFGERSWRYSVVIKNEKVEKIFIEVSMRVVLINLYCLVFFFYD